MNLSRQALLNRSKKIRFMRRLMPVLAVIFACIVVLYMVFDRLFDQDIVGVSEKIAQKRSVENIVGNPEIHTTDQRGVPVDISADRAHQKEEGIADFENPKGVMHYEQGQTLRVRSDKGRYEKGAQFFRYQDNVVALLEDGHRLRTSQAIVKTDSRKLSTDQIVFIDGPLGEGTAEKGLIYDQPTDQLDLNGHTVMNLNTTRSDAPRSATNSPKVVKTQGGP